MLLFYQYLLNKNKIIIILFSIIFLIINKSVKQSSLIINFSKKNNLRIMPFYQLFNNSISKKTILIFEPNNFHHECLPGYTKYFIELGFNVDILINNNAIDSFCLFKEIEKIRILIFNNIKDIYLNSKNLSIIIKKYIIVFVQTNFKFNQNLYYKLGLLNLNNSFFASHDTKLENFTFLNFSTQNRIWTLGHFSRGLYVNPHYFGNIKMNEKNKKVRFFITSTPGRNYKYLIEAVKRLKQKNYNFDIIVLGRSKKFKFNSKSIPQNLNDTFIFKFETSYSELYKSVESSDYIIIPLDSNNKIDREYKFRRVTGSMQLIYGFLKPAIINKDFSDFYLLSRNNSLIYNNNIDFYNIMQKAILLNNAEYNNLRNNLEIIETEINDISIDNIKRAFNKKGLLF